MQRSVSRSKTSAATKVNRNFIFTVIIRETGFVLKICRLNYANRFCVGCFECTKSFAINQCLVLMVDFAKDNIFKFHLHKFYRKLWDLP